MSSYQQIPVGIPASQNPYPSIPYSQNFPDEPVPEASQLQAPLNNPPQHYYPPQQYYGQQSVLMGQPGQFYGAPQGYNQQPEYMMVPVDPERRQLWTKIKNIEERLGNGWYFVYIVWLWFIIIGSILAVIQLVGSFLFYLIVSSFERERRNGMYQESAFTNFVEFISFFVQISWYVWSFQQSLVFKNAMNDKNLNAARRGLKSMIWLSGYYLVTFIAHNVFLPSTFPKEFQDKGFLASFLIFFIILCAITTYLKFYGAKKIIELLAERETLVLDFNTRYSANLA